MHNVHIDSIISEVFVHRGDEIIGDELISEVFVHTEGMKEARLSRQMLRLVVCPHPASGGEAVHQSTSQWTSSADSEPLLRKD